MYDPKISRLRRLRGLVLPFPVTGLHRTLEGIKCYQISHLLGNRGCRRCSANKNQVEGSSINVCELPVFFFARFVRT
jgi:hypothetical protein